MSNNKMSSPNQSLTNGDLLLASPANNSNQSQLNKSTNRPLKLRRVNHKDEIVFGFSSLLRNESMTDVTLICNGGQTIRAHRVILSTFSPYFRAIFEAQPFSNNPCQYPVIVIKDLELNELKTIIDFIYKGEVSVSRDKLQSVLQAAKALEVSGLADLKSEAFGVNSNAQTNSVNTLLANSLMSSPSTVNQSSNLNDLNFGSLSALNYVCNLNNNKRDNNSLNNSLDNDLFNENQLNRLRVSIEDSSELLNSLNTSLLGDNTVNIDGVRSLLQQPPRVPQTIQQLKQQAQLNQLNQMTKQRQIQLLQQRQHIQRIQQQQQNRQLQQQQQQQNRQLQQQILQLNQNSNLKNKYSVPKNSLQGQNLVQFQEKIKQQIQEKQQQQQQQQKSENTNGNDKSNKDQDVEEIVDSNDMNGDENVDENGDDKLMDQNDQNDLIVDDENNNQINKLNEDGQLDDNKNSDDKNDDDLENGANGYVEYDEGADANQLNGDDEEYEIDINKDLVFQRQQQIRLEQLKNQQHFQQQLQLLQVDDPENRSDFQKQLFQAVGLRNANDLNGDALNGRRNSSKDSLLQTSSASGSEDTDNDNNNDNTMDINDNLGDNLSIMENNFFDDYNNLTSGSPIPMQVKLSPQLSRIPQTPDFLLPRGPGRPRKGNKGSDISPCPECHKKFVRPDVLKLHYRSVHLLERHPCNMCEKVFKWPGDLSKHKRKSCKGNVELAINRNKISSLS